MSLESILFLTDTDTTVGFVSQNRKKLDRIKGRPPGKSYITVLPSCSHLRARVRIPKAHAKRVRRASRTTFIFPNGRSYRIVRDPRHLMLLLRLEWAYSTSANPSGKPFDEAFARSRAEVVIEPLRAGGTPSRIYRLGRKRCLRIR